MEKLSSSALVQFSEVTNVQGLLKTAHLFFGGGGGVGEREREMQMMDNVQKPEKSNPLT